MNPWSEDQGESGNTWAWLGSAMQATKRIAFGTLTIPCSYRYHPVIIAQTVATLAEMHPGRLKWIAAGSGEALNECVVSPTWPQKTERNARLCEGINIMRSLLKGKTVNKTDGYHYTSNAKIWSLPTACPDIIGAALTFETATLIAPWVDGLLTVFQNRKQVAMMMDAFCKGGGTRKQVYVQLHISWHPDLKQAIENALDQWRCNLGTPYQLENLRTPRAFEQVAAEIKVRDLEGSVHIGSEAQYFVDLITDCVRLGVAGVIIHNVGKNQEDFIRFFGSYVLPEIRTESAAFCEYNKGDSTANL